MKRNITKNYSHKSKFVTEELKILKARLLNAKKAKSDQKDIPIYLILGPEHFGKSTLLANSGLNLVDINHQKLDHQVTPTKYCNLWFSSEALYIDTAGHYTASEVTELRNDIIWQGFIKLLIKYFGSDAIAGIIVVLDLPELLHNSSLVDKILFQISERIYEIASLLKTLKIHLVLTKCDRILGFREFFASLSQEEIKAPFGMILGQDKNDNISIELENKFKELIQQLNYGVIKILRETASPSHKLLVKLFPSAFAQLRALLFDVTNKIPHSQKITLAGIYFTSSIQNGPAIDLLGDRLQNALSSQMVRHYTPTLLTKHSYFVEGLFKNIFPLKIRNHKNNHKPPMRNRILTIILFMAIIITSFTGSLLIYQSYQKNLKFFDRVIPSLQHNLTKNNILPHQEIEKLESEANSWKLRLGTNRAKQLYKKLVCHNRKVQLKKTMALLEDHLIQLSNQTTTDGKKLYYALKLYLMLRGDHKVDPIFVKNWFHHNKYNLELPIDTNILLASLEKQTDVVSQHDVVTTVRDKLNTLPQHQLIYLIFENSYGKTPFGKSWSVMISPLYLKKNFSKVYNKMIPRLAKHPKVSDWVIGNITASLDEQDGELLPRIRNYYIENYIAACQELLLGINKYQKPSNLTELIGFLQRESSRKSIFATALKDVLANSTVPNPPIEFTKSLEQQLKDLSETNPANIAKMLADSLNYFADIAKGNVPEQLLFNVLAGRLQNTGTDNPLVALEQLAEQQAEPLKSYLLTIVSSSWSVVSRCGYRYITDQWHKNILPIYRRNLDGRYPFVKQSEINVSLKDFNAFFAPHGIMDRFFTQYIEPLIDIDGMNWQWKKTADLRLDFPPDFLEFFLRAALIQKMFYPLRTPTPKLSFTMTPLTMTPQTQNFTLHLDGQQLSYTNGNDKTKQTLFWPGPKSESVIFSFTDNHGKYMSVTEIGEWAWFRTLNKAVLDTSHGSKRIELSFNLHDNSIKYLIATEYAINAFMMEIINDFRLH